MYVVDSTDSSCRFGLLTFRSSMKLTTVAAKMNNPSDSSTSLVSSSFEGQVDDGADKRTMRESSAFRYNQISLFEICDGMLCRTNAFVSFMRPVWRNPC